MVVVIDMRNTAVSNRSPLIIGFAVAAIGMSFGANAGYAINPARDFGPPGRLLRGAGGRGVARKLHRGRFLLQLVLLDTHRRGPYSVA